MRDPLTRGIAVDVFAQGIILSMRIRCVSRFIQIAMLWALIMISAPVAAVTLQPGSIDPPMQVVWLHGHRLDLDEFSRRYEQAAMILVLVPGTRPQQDWQIQETWVGARCDRTPEDCHVPDANSLSALIPKAIVLKAIDVIPGLPLRRLMFLDHSGAALSVVDESQLLALRTWAVALGSKVMLPNASDSASGRTPVTQSTAKRLVREMRRFDQAIETRNARGLADALAHQKQGIRFPSLRHALCDMALTGWDEGLDMIIAEDPRLIDAPCAHGLTPLAAAMLYARRPAIATLVRHGASDVGTLLKRSWIPGVNLKISGWTMRQFLNEAKRDPDHRDLSQIAAARDLAKFVAAQIPRIAKRLRQEQPALWGLLGISEFPDHDAARVDDR